MKDSEYYDYYTAVVMQTEFNCIRDRKEIKAILDRICKLIDRVAVNLGASGGAVDRHDLGWAPVKLIAFPEFFLQGYWYNPEIGGPHNTAKNIAIEIPGEETAVLSKKAIEKGIYIVGQSLEVVPDWPDRFLNCGYIIAPSGEIILKYHKFTPALHLEYALSPHDMFDLYMEKFGKGKTILETFFPVVDTPIGKLGIITCTDGFFPENARALAMQGAEVIMRISGSIEPWGIDYFELSNRSRAWENLAYVVAPTAGPRYSEEIPKSWSPGGSMIVDYNGRVLCKAGYPGETITSAVIRLEELRRRRMDFAGFNFPAWLRTEVYKEIYRDPVYPKNLFAETPALSFRERMRKEVIDAFVAKGIYTKPKYG